MPDSNEYKRHIIFSGRNSSENYTSPKTGGNGIAIKQRTASEHGEVIRAKLEMIRVQSEQLQNEMLPQGIIREDVVYVEFISDFDVELAFESFEDNRSGKYHLLSCQKEGNQYRAVVALNNKGISNFIKKIEAYSTEVTKKGAAKNAKLFSNILDIRFASLKSFWNEPTLEFPIADQEIWWEVWIRREDFLEDNVEDSKVVDQLNLVGATIGQRRLILPEHIIRLVRGTPNQLSNSLLLLDNLGELRKAKDTAEFFTELRTFEQQEWLNDLLQRTDNQTNVSPLAICILDTGVNNGHPLIAGFLPNGNMDSVNPAWGNLDGHGTGHGTQMAGLALYGDLIEPLASTGTIQIFHQLESVKLINANAPHEPEIYGQVTIECVNRAIVIAPTRKRVFCMAVTSSDNRDRGKPSSWSSSVDKIIFGESGTSDDKNIILISVGNVDHDNHLEYPAKNRTEFIHDPAQAFNCIAVGGYTEKDSINLTEFPGSVALAPRGNISPSSSTSCLSVNQWPIKPDIVMEAGNYAVQDDSIICPDSLQLLTTAKDYSTSRFTAFGDTSAATALASNLFAKIFQQYNDLWLESIRGVMIHSSTWTSQMLGGANINALSYTSKRELLRTFGYGVPDLNKALHSLNNSLTLIAQRTIQPFRLDGSIIKTGQLHIYDLPWPIDVLEGLGGQSVKLTVTLSYFIEPNPGSKYFSSKYYYQSHGLRFNMKRPLESQDEFKVRINKEAREEDEVVSAVAQSGQWMIGEKLRNTGSIHKDIWVGTGAELASMNSIAVYPVNGWWRFRKKAKRYDKQVRYSLLINIESTSNEIDLYTPVQTLVTVTV
jgi:hypothetical protein